MKNKIFFFLGLLLASLGIMAQTDVTNQYLTNAGFDEETDFVGSVVYTYASDANNNGGVSSCQQVTGWSADAVGDAKAGGVFHYGSGYGLSGTSYIVPAADAEGHAVGGALGLAGCWGNSIGYYQEVNLPAGLYRISYKVYNAGVNNIANYDNQIGFIEDSSGATHYAKGEFYAGEWTEGMIYFFLTAETSGRIHVGNSCANVGSGNTPKLFLDYIKIETYTSTDNSLLDYMTHQVDTEGWGGSGTYTAEGITGRETFQWAASLPLGERMGQTISGLPNGDYHLSMSVAASSTSGRDNTGNVITDGSVEYVSLHANDVSHGVPAYNRTEFGKYDRIELNNVQVTDGTLKIYLNQDNTGPNWLVMQIRELSCVRQIPPLRYIIGDVNEDEDVTIADVTSLVNIILGKQSNYRMEISDVNEDGGVTIADVTSLVNIILGKQPVKLIDNNYLYTNISAIVFTEQSAFENGTDESYIMQSATTRITGEDVSDKVSIGAYLTTINLSTSLDNVASVSFYSLDHARIAGPMSVLTAQGLAPQYDYSEGSESTYANSLESDVVTVSGFNMGTYVAYLRPVALTNGLMVTVRTTDGKFYSQTFTGIQIGKENNLTFTETSASNLWMSTLPGNTYFSMLSTPGAHDAATSSVTDYTSMAKCQSESIAELLANGVRAFDLRPRYTSNTQSDIELDNLTIYHGYVSTGVKFKDAIDILINFVKENPSEAVSVIMNKESTKLLIEPTDQSETWRASIRECFSDASRSPYLMGSVRGFHTLDDVRGKISIVSRNPYGNSSNGFRDVVYGAIIENWPDDDVVTDYSCDMTQAWNWTDCRASVEDAYNSNTNTKKTQVQTQLELANSNTDHFHYNYTYTSIANSPASYADTMNPATVSIIASLKGPLCYVYADFMGSSSYSGQALLKAVIEQNYKYVFKGRSRVEQQ